MKKYLLLFIISAASLHSFANRAEDSTLFDVGYVKDRVYRNDFLNFEFKIPSNWNHKFDEGQKIMNRAIKQAYKESNELHNYLDPDDIDVFFLIILSRQYTPGQKSTPNMILMVENISKSGLISTPSDYLYASIRGLKMSSPDVKVSNDPFVKYDFGREFYGCSAKNKSNGMKFNQDIYATVIGQFAFAVITTYQDKADKPELMSILESFTFRSGE